MPETKNQNPALETAKQNLAKQEEVKREEGVVSDNQEKNTTEGQDSQESEQERAKAELTNTWLFRFVRFFLRLFIGKENADKLMDQIADGVVGIISDKKLFNEAVDNIVSYFFGDKGQQNQEGNKSESKSVQEQDEQQDPHKKAFDSKEYVREFVATLVRLFEENSKGRVSDIASAKQYLEENLPELPKAQQSTEDQITVKKALDNAEREFEQKEGAQVEESREQDGGYYEHSDLSYLFKDEEEINLNGVELGGAGLQGSQVPNEKGQGPKSTRTQ